MTDDTRRAEELYRRVITPHAASANRNCRACIDAVVTALRAARDEGLEEAKEAIEENRQLRAASMQMNVAKLIINAADEKRIRTEARDDGLEKAAKHIDVSWERSGKDFAAAIRSLKSKGGE